MKIEKSINLLSQAISVVADSGNSELVEARIHMKKALQKLEEANKKKVKKSLPNAENWWGEVVTHVPMAKMSETSAFSALKSLDSMIAEEKGKLEELEKPKVSGVIIE